MYLRSIVLALVLFGCHPVSAQMVIHVSTEGRKDGLGSIEDPLGSLSEARDRIRELRSTGDKPLGSIEVIVHEGVYELDATMEWTAEDSGDENAPILYRGEGQVELSGGRRLDSWTKLTNRDLLDRLPPSARNHCYSLRLTEVGVDAGTIECRRLHQPMPSAPIELYTPQEKLARAGWPNHGWDRVQPISHSSLHWVLGRRIAIADRSHVWGHGFWENDGSDSFQKIDTDGTGTIVHWNASPERPSSVRSGTRYRLCNLLAELDSPGEWFHDKASGELVAWIDPERDEITATRLDTVLSLYDVDFVTLKNFHIGASRAMGVEVVGGSHVTIEQCRISRVGQVGVHLFRGSDHRLVGCDVSLTGSSGVRVEGGDRNTLTASNHKIEGCNIFDFCSDYLSGRAGIACYGVGVRVVNNHIHRGPDTAIAIFGNEHLIENNEIDHVCREQEDSAAVHLAYDPTYRGNVIRRNYIHDLGGFSKSDVFGIYLDDFASGTLVEENFLQRTIRGILIGGGRDNVVSKNVIVESLVGIQLDARGKSWAKNEVAGAESRIGRLYRQIGDELPLFIARYPTMKSSLEDDLGLPRGNRLQWNEIDCTVGIDLQNVERNLVAIEGNLRAQYASIAKSEEERNRRVFDKLGIVYHPRQERESIPTSSLVRLEQKERETASE